MLTFQCEVCHQIFSSDESHECPGCGSRLIISLVGIDPLTDTITIAAPVQPASVTNCTKPKVQFESMQTNRREAMTASTVVFFVGLGFSILALICGLFDDLPLHRESDQMVEIEEKWQPDGTEEEVGPIDQMDKWNDLLKNDSKQSTDKQEKTGDEFMSSASMFEDENSTSTISSYQEPSTGQTNASYFEGRQWDLIWIRVLLDCVATSFLAAAIILMLTKLHRGWKLVQRLRQIDTAQHRMPTPRQSIGFLFVPFFNVYWIFVALVGLIGRANSLLRDGMNDRIVIDQGMSVVLCLNALLMFTVFMLSLIPIVPLHVFFGLNVLFYLLLLSCHVTIYLYVQQLTRIINVLGCNPCVPANLVTKATI